MSSAVDQMRIATTLRSTAPIVSARCARRTLRHRRGVDAATTPGAAIVASSLDRRRCSVPDEPARRARARSRTRRHATRMIDDDAERLRERVGDLGRVAASPVMPVDGRAEPRLLARRRRTPRPARIVAPAASTSARPATRRHQPSGHGTLVAHALADDAARAARRHRHAVEAVGRPPSCASGATRSAAAPRCGTRARGRGSGAGSRRRARPRPRPAGRRATAGRGTPRTGTPARSASARHRRAARAGARSCPTGAPPSRCRC